MASNRRTPPPSDAPFPTALLELLRENDYVNSIGNVNLHAFVRELDGVHYETVRKAVAGIREPTPHLIEECARVLRVAPEHFVEYRLHQAVQSFDVSVVGHEQALANLKRWAAEQQHSLETRRRRRNA